jgi:hypothetical protein
MNDRLNKHAFPVWFTLFVGFIVLLTFSLNMINGRFWLADFRIYYSAAQQFMCGGQVYLVSFNDFSGFYKYSPALLYLFLPYGLLSYKAASIIHFFLLGSAFLFTFLAISDLLKKYVISPPEKLEQLLLILSFTCILIHFTREMYMGNINIILLLMICFAYRGFLAGRMGTCGVLLGMVILAKPYFIILLLPLLLRKQWKLLAGILGIVSAGLLLPFIFPGPGRAIGLYTDWYRSILKHNMEFPSMNSLEYLIRHYCFPSIPAAAGYLIPLAACFLASWFIISNIKREKKAGNENEAVAENLIFEWFIMLAMLPVVFKTDWVQFLYLAPVITYIIFYTGTYKKFYLVPVLVLLFFFFSANSDDLLGRPLSRKLLEMGVMGISSMFIILTALIIYRSVRKAGEG